jgi:hypothetical protein
VTRQIINQGAGTTSFKNLPTYSHTTYQQLISQWAALNPRNPAAASDMQNALNQYFNFGWVGRPLDKSMEDILSQKNLPADYYVGPHGIPYLHADQAIALNNGGWSDFIQNSTVQKLVTIGGKPQRVFVILPFSQPGAA